MKNKLIIVISIIMILIVAIVSFNYIKNKNKIPEYNGNIDTESVKKYSNDNIEPKQLDSLDFIKKISSQKLQELYDILIVSNNNKDNNLNTILSNQLKNYFLEEDTLQIKTLLRELDSLKVGYVKVNSINVLKNDNEKKDSIGKVNFTLNLYQKNKKFLSNIEKSVKYTIKVSSEKQNKVFKYYFTSFGEKDTIQVGVTK